MDHITGITNEMFHRALELHTLQDAAKLLQETGHFRNMGDILNAYTDDPKHRLVEGLLAHDPKANRDSLDRKVRNWLSGRTRSVGKRDAYELCQIMELNLSQTDDFLKAVIGEGIHWRSPEEIVWCYGLHNHLSYERIVHLLNKVREMPRNLSLREWNRPDYTQIIRGKLHPILDTDEETLLYFLSLSWDVLGPKHNTAYALFSEYMEILELGSSILGPDFEEKMTSQEILEAYLYRSIIPVSHQDRKREAYSEVQRSIRMNWPDETTLSKMKHRELDVSRKVLILLFLATNGGDLPEEDWESEVELNREELFWTTYLRLDRMLTACGFGTLDPRSPFDWLVLYCICVDDLWDIDQRMAQMLRELFPENQEHLA